MNDQLLINNYLILLKGTTEVYVHGTLESTNQDIREDLKSCLNQILSLQANVYDEMVKYGWYPTNNIEVKTIRQTLNKLNQNN